MLNFNDNSNSVVKTLTPKKNPYQQFSKLFLGVTLFPLVLIGSLNYLVNPYGIFKNAPLASWNFLKPHQDNNVRLFKAIEVIERKPKIGLLGSSTMILGLDPNHSVFSHQSNTYNLGLTGVYIDELNYYFKHLIANQQQIETIILGLDFFTFKKLEKKQISYRNILGKTQTPWSNIVETNFSVDTFIDSLDTVKINLSNKNPSPNELYYNKGMRNNVLVSQDFANKSIKSAFAHQISTYFHGFYKNYELDYQGINKLESLVKECQNKNIKLKVFISPIHASQLEAIRSAGLWSDFEKWKTEVSKIVPVWDFSTYNSVTTEPINNNIKYFFDSAHYRQKVGDLILNRLYNLSPEKVPSDFGILLSKNNIDEHLKTVRMEREKWSKNHGDVIKFVADIKTK